MRIVHVITRLIVGGAQENTLLSCEGQHRLGHEVALLTGPPAGPEGSLLERARASGYRVEIVEPMKRSILPWQDLQTYRYLKRRFGEIRPDVVHTHSSKAGILGRWAAAAAGVSAVIHTIHGLSFTASTHAPVNAMYRGLERRAARVSTRIVCVADAMRAASLAAGIGTPGQYVTVYSGMDTSSFLSPPVPREQARAALGLREGDVAVGTIARLFHMKGHHDLLELAPGLCRRFPRLRFLWVGDGLLRPEFERRIAAMGLSDRFILTGLVPPERVPELVGAMDILVHPSRREGLARALPQGALAGCPVVTYDVDGNSEGLIDGQTGYCLPAFDVPLLGTRLGDLISDASLRLTMGDRGRAFAVGRFDTAVMVNALEGVYANAVAGSVRKR